MFLETEVQSAIDQSLPTSGVAKPRPGRPYQCHARPGQWKWQLHARTDSTQIDISGEIEWKSDVTGRRDSRIYTFSLCRQLANLHDSMLSLCEIEQRAHTK